MHPYPPSNPVYWCLTQGMSSPVGPETDGDDDGYGGHDEAANRGGYPGGASPLRPPKPQHHRSQSLPVGGPTWRREA
jgi:hypothetical protein